MTLKQEMVLELLSSLAPSERFRPYPFTLAGLAGGEFCIGNSA